jgi:hypothetical protein
MSNAEELEAVDVPELEEEDALFDDDVMPELGDNLVQGEMVHRPLVPLDYRGASRILSGTSSISGTTMTFFCQSFSTSSIQSPWRSKGVTSLFTCGCLPAGFGSPFQT